MSYKSHDQAAVYTKDGTPLYGLSAELYLKTQGKRDEKMEREVEQWITSVTGESFKKSGDLEESLRDGVLLCKLVNKIKPGIVSKVNNSRLPFMQMENISNFLKAVDQLGLGRHDQFQTVDLYEGKNMPQVVSSLYALGGLCQGKLASSLPADFPKIGVKHAVKREIVFTEQQLREAANTIGGQTGAASIKIDVGRSIRNEVVKTSEKPMSGEMTQASVASKKIDVGRSIGREVVKTSEKSTNEVTQTSIASKKIDVGRSISHEVVKTKAVGSNIPSQQNAGSLPVEHQHSISHEVVKIKPTTPTSASSNGSGSGSSSLDDLEKLAELRDKGILTEEEFQAKKKQILGL